MKKIKLLTPILGLTALASAMIPLASCSCNKTEDNTNKCTVKIDSGDHGVCEQESIKVEKGKKWSDVKGSINDPKCFDGWYFECWRVDGIMINDDYVINDDVKIVASYLTYIPPITEYVNVKFESAEHVSISGSATIIKGSVFNFAKSQISVTVDEGYGIDKWVDANGNTIALDTKINDDMTIKPVVGLVTFETDTWENVCKYAKEGLEALKQHYGIETFIGLERTILFNGLEYIVRVVGEDWDTIYDETATELHNAPLSFESITLASDRYGNPYKSAWDSFNNLDYLNSILRANIEGQGNGKKTLDRSCYEIFAEENPILADNLKNVQKSTYGLNPKTQRYDCYAYSSKFYPISVGEFAMAKAPWVPICFLFPEMDYVDHERSYEFYDSYHAAAQYKVRKDPCGIAHPYWTRVCRIDSEFVSTRMEDDGTFAKGISPLVTEKNAFTFGFCI